MKTLNWQASLFCIFSFFYSEVGRTGDSVSSKNVPVVQEERESVQLIADIGYHSATIKGTSLNSIEIGIQALYGLNSRWALVGLANQGFSTDAFSNSFTAIGFGAEYFFSGSPIRLKKKISLGQFRILTSKPLNETALSASVITKQYYFNGSSNVFPLSGLGICGSYLKPMSSVINARATTCYEFLANPPVSAQAIRLFLSLTYFL